mmetsp:Transcript_4207/g.6176  ORF Transcript_4207/g.6176 Transcript_4207/m.6176 type:complete len:103 (-) Transcript_4207:191-499(-)
MLLLTLRCGVGLHKVMIAHGHGIVSRPKASVHKLAVIHMDFGRGYSFRSISLSQGMNIGFVCNPVRLGVDLHNSSSMLPQSLQAAACCWNQLSATRQKLFLP